MKFILDTINSNIAARVNGLLTNLGDAYHVVTNLVGAGGQLKKSKYEKGVQLLISGIFAKDYI